MIPTSAVRRQESAAMRVLAAVAAARDTEIEALEPPLAKAIDPDALGAILDGNPESDVAVSFTYADCRITVTGDDVDARYVGDDGT